MVGKASNQNRCRGDHYGNAVLVQYLVEFQLHKNQSKIQKLYDFMQAPSRSNMILIPQSSIFKSEFNQKDDTT